MSLISYHYREAGMDNSWKEQLKIPAKDTRVQTEVWNEPLLAVYVTLIIML